MADASSARAAVAQSMKAGQTESPFIDDDLSAHGELFVFDSPQDPRCSTNSGAAEFWRRLSGPVSPNVLTVYQVSSVNLRRLLQPAFFSLLSQRAVQRVVTSSESPLKTDLHSSLRDLDDAVAEAAEEGFPRPTLLALTNARRLLWDLYRLRPSRLEVYPTPDGEIALVVRGGLRQSVLVLCGSNGGVLCSVNLDGQHRRASYDDATTLPDGFVREAVRDLDEPDRAW